MQHLPKLSPIADHYDAFLMDLWGVVHDGSHLYPGAHEALTQLKRAGKKIIMVSNAPRRATKAAQVLTQLGVEPHLYDAVITSGEMGYLWLSGDVGMGGWGENGGNSSPHLHISTSSHPFYYYIGPSKDADVLAGLDYQRVDDIKAADFLLNVGFGSEEESSQDWQMLLRGARGLKLPMLCLNPDFEVVKISGEHYPCAGVLAADYEKLGGQVKYFGKPFPEVYEWCMQFLFPPQGGKEKVLAIGDGIATDIAGAVGFGIDAALVTGGILKKKAQDLEALCAKHNAVPKYVLPALVW